MTDRAGDLDIGVIRVMALGNAGFAIRIRDEAVRADIAAHSRFASSTPGAEWVGADAWPHNLPRDEGTARVREWLTAAFAEAPGAPGEA